MLIPMCRDEKRSVQLDTDNIGGSSQEPERGVQERSVRPALLAKLWERFVLNERSQGYRYSIDGRPTDQPNGRYGHGPRAEDESRQCVLRHRRVPQQVRRFTSRASCVLTRLSQGQGAPWTYAR